MKRTGFSCVGVVVLLGLLGLTRADAQTIDTYAGGGNYASVPATQVAVGGPTNVVVGPSGHIYFSDTTNSNVFKYDPIAGTVTRIAGTDTFGFSGDNGPATGASLSVPRGLAFDGNGNLYIVDGGNEVVRRVDASGTISTFAGTPGIAGFSGNSGPAVAAQLSFPVGVAVDAVGNVYISDAANQVIRRVDTSGIISTYAGTPQAAGYSGDGGPAINAQLNVPLGLHVDLAGNLYIAHYLNQIVRLGDTSGNIRTFAGTPTVSGFGGDGGLATGPSAALNLPTDVTIDSNGNLYIADRLNERIRMVSALGVLSTVAGTGTSGFSGDGGAATSGNLYTPSGIAVDGQGNLYIGDYFNNRLREVSFGRVISTLAGNGTFALSGDGGALPSAMLQQPNDVVSDSAGNLYILDAQNQVVRKVTPAGVLSTVAGNGVAGYNGDNIPAVQASLNYPKGIAVDASSNLYIADYINNLVRKVDANGVISTFAGGGGSSIGDGGPATNAVLTNPYGVAVDAARNVYIADEGNQRIRMVDTAGNIWTVAGGGSGGDGGPATSASLVDPVRVAVDVAGNLYIADGGTSTIRMVTPANLGGIISTFAGNGTAGLNGDGGPATAASLNNPHGIAVDAAGTLLIADTQNSVIRQVFAGPSGRTISTVAGNGAYGFSGDGGPMLNASMASPWGVAVDAKGNLFIADTNNNRVREVVGYLPDNTPIGNAVSVEPIDPTTGIQIASVTVALPPLPPVPRCRRRLNSRRLVRHR